MPVATRRGDAATWTRGRDRLAPPQVKAFAWEAPCLDAVARIRKKEADTILRAQLCRAVTTGLYFCTTALATFAAYFRRVGISRRWVAAPPRLRRGYSVETSAAAPRLRRD